MTTEQEKQMLSGLCKIEIRRWKAAAEAVPDKRYMVELMEIALASLTAPPVKLPESNPIHCEMDFIRKEKARSWNEAISRCSHNIRAAGYQVEE